MEFNTCFEKGLNSTKYVLRLMRLNTCFILPGTHLLPALRETSESQLQNVSTLTLDFEAKFARLLVVLEIKAKIQDMDYDDLEVRLH